MIIFIAFSVIYIGFLLWIRWHWTKIKVLQATEDTDISFSVLIPIRNESENIINLLSDLKRQEYPKEQFEVIIIDDQSSDDSHQKVSDFIRSNDVDWKLISVNENDGSGKKYAITSGVSVAKNDYIITVDGDCSVGRKWLAAYATQYALHQSKMVTGPVNMRGYGLFQRLQGLEFSGLIGIGAATLRSGNPTMCNGANLSYHKATFDEVHGYQGNENIPSGDDEFLLQKIYKRYPDRVSFLKSSDAIVDTQAKMTFLDLLSQRIRWSSKWRFHKSFFIKLMAMMGFLNYLSLFMSILEMTQNNQWVFLSIVLCLRWVALFYFSYPIAQFFSKKDVLWMSLMIEIIYPFFVIFLGIASIFGKYSWKGRHYS